MSLPSSNAMDDADSLTEPQTKKRKTEQPEEVGDEEEVEGEDDDEAEDDEEDAGSEDDEVGPPTAPTT